MVSNDRLPQGTQLAAWLVRQGLSRHAGKLMDASGTVGLETLADFAYLTARDVEGIADSCGMTLVEKRRFLRAAEALRSPGAPAIAPEQPESPRKSAEVPPAKEEVMSLAGPGMTAEQEAADVDELLVLPDHVYIWETPSNSAMDIGVLNQGCIVHTHRERIMGANGQVWAEVTAPDVRQWRQRGAEASRGFVLVDGNRFGLDGPQLMGPLQDRSSKPPGGSVPVDIAGIADKGFREALGAFEDMPDSADLFEVVMDGVSIMKSPGADARCLGTLERGRVIQVKRKPVQSSDSNMWVELTSLEMWRSCAPEDAGDRGFVPVQSRLQGAQLLGPLDRDPKAWLPLSHSYKHLAKPALAAHGAKAAHAGGAAPAAEPLAFCGLETYAHLWEVAERVVYVKSGPSKDAKTIGCLSGGQIIQALQSPVCDSEGHKWVELTSHELWHSCRPESAVDQGFALVDGEHLGLGALLKGPLPEALRQQWQKDQLEEHRRSMQLKLAEEAARERDARDVQQRIKDPSWTTVTYTYRAMGEKVFIKWSDDPRCRWFTKSSCKPGTAFYSTGMEWLGPSGEQWIDGVEADGKPRWLLAFDPSTMSKKYLVDEKYLEEHICVRVNYPTVLGPKVFRAYLDANASGSVLTERFSKEVNIREELITIKVPALEALAEATDLKAAESLESQRITSASQLSVRWDPDLYQGISLGRRCGWL